MKIHEAWRLSRIPYVETIYKSAQLVGGSPQLETADAQERVQKVLRNAKTNKAMFAFFGCLGAAVPFAINPTPVSMVSSIALSLLIGFAYLILFTLQVLPSLSSADTYSLMLSLPFNEREYALVTTLSFLRTFDYLAVGSILVPFAAVAVLTRSLPATLLMLGAAAINVALAVFLGLWLSRLFYKTLTRGGRSRLASISRTVFIIAWGFAVLSVGFAFQLVTSFLPTLHQVLAGGLSHSYGRILLVLHPFAFGVAVSSLAFPAYFTTGSNGAPVGPSLDALAYVATAAYVVIAALVVVRASRTLSDISHGLAQSVVRQTTKEFTLKVRKPLVAFVLKDVRVTSKNPSTAFTFVLPAFGVLVFFTAISKGGIVNMYDILILTSIASTFALMAGPMTLNSETRGQFYALTLPISLGILVQSKTLFMTLTYLPVPFLLAAIQLLGSRSMGVVSIAPFLQVLSVYAGATAEIALFMRGSASGGMNAENRPRTGLSSSTLRRVSGFSFVSGTNLIRAVEAIAVAIVTVLAPAASYLGTHAIGYSQPVSLVAMAVVIALEAGVAFVLARRTA